MLLGVSAVLLLVGTFHGTDDDFPFGPFRMYATADDPNGAVLSARLEAVTTEGTVVRVSEGDIGMRRAEYEGQLDRVTPAVLGDLAAVHTRRRPDAPRWVELRLLRDAFHLKNGRPGTTTTRVLATWRAS